MYDLIQIKEHAVKAATEGQGEDACPFVDTSTHALLWLDYYRTQVRAGQSSA